MGVRKLSVALDEQVADAAVASAERHGLSLSAWLNRAAENALAIEDGLAAVAEWEAEHGALLRQPGLVGGGTNHYERVYHRFDEIYRKAGALANPNSPVIKANLVETCAKCHPGATTNFPGAWLSHYEPSISKSPFVFFVGWFYKILIPFILVGLFVHIMLDLWRRITNR